MTEGLWEGRGQVAPQGVRRPFVQSENALRASAVHEPSTGPDSRARHQICVQITGCATLDVSLSGKPNSFSRFVRRRPLRR